MNYLIVGLGNIGAEYANTRHNIGFMVLDAWAQASNTCFTTDRYGAIAQVSEKGRKFTLLKPSTYMNLSGKAVRYWKDKLDVPLERIIIISDDLNLTFGSVRLRGKGSDGGHNGLKNITELLESQDYPRIRVGIGNDYSKGEQIDFVLGDFSEQEKKIMEELTKKVIDGIKAYAFIGLERAMNIVNTKAKSAI